MFVVSHTCGAGVTQAIHNIASHAEIDYWIDCVQIEILKTVFLVFLLKDFESNLNHKNVYNLHHNAKSTRCAGCMGKSWGKSGFRYLQ